VPLVEDHRIAEGDRPLVVEVFGENIEQLPGAGADAGEPLAHPRAVDP
jgi:hypothetical protein